MPQVDFNTFIFIIMPFILILILFFNYIGYFYIILANIQKKNENFFTFFHFLPKNTFFINFTTIDQEQESLTKIK